MIASCSEGEEESPRRVWTNSPAIIRKSATQRAQGRQAVLLRQAEAFEPVHRVAGRNRRWKYASVAFGGGRVSWTTMTSFPWRASLASTTLRLKKPASARTVL